ncbi:hypothetical protein [Nocardioides solisilvae]|uniref:hypothetical protein n=1 Tax=Nocardioides solisilvae TaxID=1542435 RepID=UPI000D743EB4|nr:hypothetical protein [Nocardioides solisilvae]
MVALRRRAVTGTARAGLVGLALLLGCLVVTAGPVAGPAAAVPAPCPDDGVVVLVEPGRLAAEVGGDDARVACDPSADGERAGTSFADAGFTLDQATRSPGFVCRVEGAPASDPCVNAAPADAYWSLWWAEADGDWVYSTRGVGTLRAPQGGHLALVWHEGDGEAEPPATSPEEAAAAVRAGGGDVLPAEREPGVADAGGLPVWVPLAVLGGLLGAGVVLTLRRRRA